MMINRIKHTAIVMFATVAAVCSGCHSDSPAPVVPEEPDIADPDQLTLCLNVSFDNSNGTRAENDPDGYEGPTGDFEKISTIRVIIVRSLNADKTQGIVEANRLVATTDEGQPRFDNLEFKVIANEQKRIYLIANESSIPDAPEGYATATEFLNSYSTKGGTQNLNAIANWTVSIPISDPENSETILGLFSNADSDGNTLRLPLTEFFDVTTNRGEIENADNVYYTNLFMTRAAAKASFYLVNQEGYSPAYDNVSIKSISISGIGSEEYVFPNNTTYSKSKWTGNMSLTNSPIRDLNMYITGFSVPNNMKPLTYLVKDLNTPIVSTNSEEERSILDGAIYFPESILETGKNYEIGVLLSSGTWLKAPLKKNNTDDTINILNIGGRDAISRNTHLKIMLTFTSNSFEAEVRVAPYIGITLDPELGNNEIVKPPKPRE